MTLRDEIREMEEKYIPPSVLEEKYRGKKRIVE